MTMAIAHLFRRNSFEKTYCGYFRKNMNGTHKLNFVTCQKCISVKRKKL